jgi:AcrR family transcriptional regulator
MEANASRSARARVRKELAKEILDAARGHLAIDGPAGLSLRAVARDLGMVPSALYRYYESRDALLTALIVEAYRGLAETAAAADRSQAEADFPARWSATTRAFRDWALAHPQEWALIFGSPVPGYRAPQDTIEPAAAVYASVGGLLGDAWRAGRLHPPPVAVPRALKVDLERFREQLVGEAPDEVVLAALVVLQQILGALSAELFGQYNDAVYARDSLWRVAMELAARTAGLDLAGAS